MQGVIHRDLKADNVFISGGITKLADFGLAAYGTGAGGQVGAYAYQSPEQAQGKPYDGRNDVFALGCMLSELLTLKFVNERTSAPSAVFAMEFDAVRAAIAESTAISPFLGTRRCSCCCVQVDVKCAWGVWFMAVDFEVMSGGVWPGSMLARMLNFKQDDRPHAADVVALMAPWMPTYFAQLASTRAPAPLATPPGPSPLPPRMCQL